MLNKATTGGVLKKMHIKLHTASCKNVPNGPDFTKKGRGKQERDPCREIVKFRKFRQDQPEISWGNPINPMYS